MVVYAPAQIISAPTQLITAPAQLPATGAVVYTALFFFVSLFNRQSIFLFAYLSVNAQMEHVSTWPTPSR